jgi:hypothetical protein
MPLEGSCPGSPLHARRTESRRDPIDDQADDLQVRVDSTIRPPTSYTNPLKLQELKAYSYGGRLPSGFELDHLISLELGGAPSDERNLWPESHKNSFDKDGLENSLRSQVCSRSISLAKAQWRIVHWPKFAGHGSKGGSGAGSLDKNCSDFSTQAQAQAWFNKHGGSASNDVAGLDGDHDGIACESLSQRDTRLAISEENG